MAMLAFFVGGFSRLQLGLCLSFLQLFVLIVTRWASALGAAVVARTLVAAHAALAMVVATSATPILSAISIDTYRRHASLELVFIAPFALRERIVEAL
jgi:hypothetical protein